MNRNLISIKKTTSIGLCIVILLNIMMIGASATPIHTATTEFLSEAQAIDNTNDIQAVIKKDIGLFEKIGISEENLSCYYATNNDLMIYEYPINDYLTAIYTIEEKLDGCIEWNIYEDAKHDTVVFDTNGHMYLNGNLVASSEQESPLSFASGGSVMPRMMNSEYSSTPYGDSDEYTIPRGYRSEDSLNLGQLLQNTTVSSVAAALAEHLLASTGAHIFTHLFFAIATGLVQEAINYDLESEAISFLVYKYERDGQFILESFYEYIGHYYAQENHRGTAIIDYYYEWVWFS